MTRNDAIERRWHELAPLFDTAWGLEGDERTRYVDALEDAELRHALMQMLESAHHSSELDDGVGALAAALIDVEPGIEGSRLGVWRVGQPIGSGGMASVFLAEREDGSYAQQVAIKILRYGLYDEEERSRFVRERRILARLEHPHIARLLDAGLTDAEVPWFALEYVDGLPITTWCDERQMDVDARLHLFSQVCATVDFAHQNLVVHRDLKPSNIFVRKDGELKLLDFGIARLLDDENNEITRTAARRLTPAYAAPEQVQGGTITTATDVYALGVLLHELLTGSRPHWGDDGALSSPSNLITGSAKESIATTRASPMRALRRRIAGDLDLILTKALQVDPAQRYVGAAELAADIERHQRGLPIHAKARSSRYRLAKFVRRHWVGLGLGAAFVLAILAGLGATLWQMQAAQAEARRADAVRDFMLVLFNGITPDESKGRTISARELLDRGVHRLDETLATQPKLEARLSTALASAYRQLGDYSQAMELVERALKHAGDVSARVAGLIERGHIQAAAGQYEQAEADLREALALGSERDDEIRLHLADLLAERGALDEARALTDAMLEHGSVRDDDTWMRLLATAGGIRFRQGDLDKAAAVLQEAHALRRTHNGDLHTQTATVAHDLGVVVLQQDDAKAATALFEQALSVRRNLLGDNHPDVAESEFNLGVALRRSGDRDGAERHITQAVATQRSLLGAQHPAIANGLNTLAVMAYEQGNLTVAIARFKEALEVTRAAYGDQHATVATMLNNLAGVQRRAGLLEDSEASAKAALATSIAALGADHYLAGVARIGLANTLADRGQTAAALTEARSAHASLVAALGPDHRDTLQGQVLVAILLDQSGDIEAAQREADTALQTGEETMPAGHPYLGRLRLVNARLAVARGECESALPSLAKSEQELTAGGAAMAVDQAWVLTSRAQCQLANGVDSANDTMQLLQQHLAQLPFVPPSLKRAAAMLSTTAKH